ncbi:MAG: NAD(P)H-hydrate dehydratase [Pyrinomonadaceae bacterium]
MQKVLTAEEMREVDSLTTEKYGIPSFLLMENAAHAAARVITEKLGGSVKGKSFLILCGKGNNGGDGAALARILWMSGAKCSVYLFGKVEQIKRDARINFEIVQKISNAERSENLRFFQESSDGLDAYEALSRAQLYDDIIIDALFGTGLNKPLTGGLASFLPSWKQHNETKNFYISLDIPSGLNADLANPIGENIKADLTITFTAPKLANVFPPASNFNGELVVANIGSPRELIDNSSSQTFVAEKRDAQDWLNKTEVRTDSYKKTRGTALIIAGSKNYSGAASLAANACFAAGAGMVSVGVPESVRGIVAAKVLNEIITRGFSETKNGAFAESAVKDVLELSEKMDVVALGCGLTSDDESTKSFVREVVENRKTPMVIDADGLNALAPFDLEGSSNLPLILTPHIGEFQRLLGTKTEVKDRIKMAREFSQKHNVILVLKGERSLVAAPSGEVVINPTGNAGISRAGSGDTLTGIIAGFLAQTYGTQKPNLENTFETVVAALYIAGLAGDIAAEKLSERLMSASNIREYLNETIRSLTN